MARKRSNGEGTWGNKVVNGNKYYFYRDSNLKYTYGKTQKEVKEKLKKKQEEQALVVDQITTFGDYMLDWIKMKKNTIEQSTYYVYLDLINSLLINYKEYDLCNKQLHNLSPKVFQEYLNSLAEKYSRASILKIWQLIKQCVTYGETQNELNTNLLVMVKVPSESNVAVKKKEIPFINNSQLDALYELIDNYTDQNNVHRYRNSNNAHAIMLIAYSGMRVGEMTALKWKNVSLDEEYIVVAEATGRIKDENGKYVMVDKTTKTETSKRIIPLPARGMEMIKYFDEFNPNHKPDDLVCLTSNKTKISRRNINRTLDGMCRDAGLPHMGIHSLRHSYGSILLDKGVNIKTISELLGHKNITTTYNIYIGVDGDSKSKAVKVFDE